MNIDNVSPVSCEAAGLRNLKKMQVPLRNNVSADLSVADDYISYIVPKGDKFVKYNSNGITSKDLWGIYERVQKQVKDGVDFFKEFSSTILS